MCHPPPPIRASIEEQRLSTEVVNEHVETDAQRGKQTVKASQCKDEGRFPMETFHGHRKTDPEHVSEAEASLHKLTYKHMCTLKPALDEHR